MNSLSHEQAQELFSDLYEGTLKPPADSAVREHLAGCESCRSEKEQFDDAMRAVKSASVSRRAQPTPPNPKEFTNRVERTIEARSGGRFFGQNLRRRLPLAVISLVMLLIALAVYFIAKRSTTGNLKEPIQRPSGSSVPSDDVRKDLPRP